MKPEPFCMKPEDKLTVYVIDIWIAAADNIGVSPAKIESARKHRQRIRQWQLDNPKLVKVPD